MFIHVNFEYLLFLSKGKQNKILLYILVNVRIQSYKKELKGGVLNAILTLHVRNFIFMTHTILLWAFWWGRRRGIQRRRIKNRFAFQQSVYGIGIEEIRYNFCSTCVGRSHAKEWDLRFPIKFNFSSHHKRDTFTRL